MKFRVVVVDGDGGERTENIIEVRKNTSMKTVVLKGVEAHVSSSSSYDELEFMREVKYLHREANDLDIFVEELKQELDLKIAICDMNNHTYVSIEKDMFGKKSVTTSYEEGLESYERAWRGQLGNEDSENNFEAYLPSKDIIIEHGNEIMLHFEEEYEIEEE